MVPCDQNKLLSLRAIRINYYCLAQNCYRLCDQNCYYGTVRSESLSLCANKNKLLLSGTIRTFIVRYDHNYYRSDKNCYRHVRLEMF